MNDNAETDQENSVARLLDDTEAPPPPLPPSPPRTPPPQGTKQINFQRREPDLDDPGEQESLSLLEDDLGSSLLSHSDPQNPYSRGIHLRIASAFMRSVGNSLASITLLTMLVVVPIVLRHAITEHRNDLAAFDSAGVMVLGSVILSTRLVYLHLTHWYMPDVQKYVVRILWMVPLYAVQSWLSLRFHEARIYIDTIRDLYEAYVIASFLYYLVELLGGQEALAATLQRKDPSLGQHAIPFNYFLQPWELGMEFMLQCKHGVLQYVVVKTMATLLTFLLEAAGLYGEGQFAWNRAYPYLAFCLNVSVMYALYCLVKLFHAINYELCHPIHWHPLGKFLCVKGVVFFTWWQSVVIFYLRAHGVIGDVGNWKADDVANGVQDYCICIEMVFFAIAHSYTFTYKEYLPIHHSSSRHYRLQNATSRRGDEGDVTVPSNTLADGQYTPPMLRLKTLNRPMRFQDAFWDSTLPKETISDIQRLRNGVDRVMNEELSPGAISLPDIPSVDLLPLQSQNEDVQRRQQ